MIKQGISLPKTIQKMAAADAAAISNYQRSDHLLSSLPDTYLSNTYLPAEIFTG